MIAPSALLPAAALLLLAAPATAHAPAPPEPVVRKSDRYWVETYSDASAARILHDAEAYRQEVTRRWLGRPPKDWPMPVPIVVKLNLPANGTHIVPGRVFCYLELLGKTEPEAEEALRHEMVHAVVQHEVPTPPGTYAPRWLHEGVAVADEVLYYDYPRRLGEKLGRTPLKAFFPLLHLPEEFNGDAFYGQAASLVLYIRQKYGTERLWTFYMTGRRFGYEAASWLNFGRSLAMFEREWTAWTYSLDSPYPRSLRGTTPPR
jgi:hypothetical protein